MSAFKRDTSVLSSLYGATIDRFNSINASRDISLETGYEPLKVTFWNSSYRIHTSIRKKITRPIRMKTPFLAHNSLLVFLDFLVSFSFARIHISIRIILFAIGISKENMYYSTQTDYFNM